MTRSSEGAVSEAAGGALADAYGPRTSARSLFRFADGIRRLPPGPLGDALRRLTPIQRAVVLAEILGPPRAHRGRGG